MENGINQNVFTDIYHQLNLKLMSLSRNNLIITGSFIWFYLMIIVCLYSNHHASALSVFGLNDKTKYIFGSCIISLSLVTLYFQEAFDFKGVTKRWLVFSIRYGSVISSISLILVALVNMNNQVHFIFAAIYFILMPVLSIIFGIIYRLQGDKTISTYLLVIGVSNFVFSFLLFIFVKNFMAAEILHTNLVFAYVYLLNKR